MESITPTVVVGKNAFYLLLLLILPMLAHQQYIPINAICADDIYPAKSKMRHNIFPLSDVDRGL
jgi:hypothetical protein